MMDTSSDFSSSTYDFLCGNGTNLPQPTGEEYARRMLDIGDRLWKFGTLKYLIGNQSVKDNHILWEGARRFLSVNRVQAIEHGRAMELKDMSSERGGFKFEHDRVVSRIFLGYTRQEVFWVLTTELYYKYRAAKVLSCRELDLAAMTELFVPYETWATPLPHTLLERLAKFLERDIEEREYTLGQLKMQAAMIAQDRGLFWAACEMPPRESGGIEG